LNNLDWIAKNSPQLRYIQIDDGYQPWMGDWLETGKSFGGNIKTALKSIRKKGFEPAIWVAPFVASPESKLFREHPEWFIKDKDGKPLRSDKVGFGGWRLGPWHALDGTHPEAQKFLENTFRTMRRDWGCTYFKLDANYWGALHKGFFHDPKATRIEAYRRGMDAILRGTGNAFILGCNHPLWPSLGLIDGSRSSMDISRNWGAIRDIGRQNLLRGWQNGRFWWNDPDCVLLSPGRVMDNSGKTIAETGLPENEVMFHAAAIHASGGMLLSSDDLPTLTPERSAALKKLIPPTKQAAGFENELLTVGRTSVGKKEYIYLFNWSNQPADRLVKFDRSASLSDFWTGEKLGSATGEYRLNALPPHTAKIIIAEPKRN
jgi:alpha-galactosidase